jgi:DNA-binding SARP family transcriptional activator
VSAPEPAATTGIAERVDLALRHGWSALRRSGRSAPSVVAVRVGDLGVEVLLDTPDPDAPGRFVASDGGHVWALGPEVADDDLRRSVGQEPAPIPALLTVGTTPEGPVLVDLVDTGVLSVEGDATLVGAFLAGAALELATASWAQATTLGLLGGDDRLGALGNVAVLGSTASHGGASGLGLSPALQSRVCDWLEEAPGVAAVVIAPGMADPAQTEAIATALMSRPGRAGLVASGPIPEARLRLVIGPDGGGVLHPLGLELGCAVDTEAVATTVAGLSSSVATRPARPTLEGPGSETQPEGPGVLVLGPVVVRWPPVPGRRRPTRRKLEEVVVYLATHPQRPVPAERLRTAIWPLSEDERAGEVADSSFRATMSRTRAALGTGPTGRPYLPEACDGCYQLDAAFGCDWVDFDALVRRSRSTPAPEAMALLGEALGLVRGAPFADSPRGAFGWAWSEQLVSAIEVAVADAAERLADLALAAGDHATARRAVEKGLLVVPSRESLYRARMRAASAAGDLDDVEQAYTEVRRAARTIGEEPQGETTGLYERLRRARRTDSEDVTAAGARPLVVVP